jgi:hypothetical protein
MMAWLILWAFTVAPVLAADDCPQPASTATLAQHISSADVAFSTMDENAFRSARWTAQRAINCMGEAIQAGQAAAYYRMEALGSFLDQNHAQTVGFFKSMLRVAPHYLLPDAMAPAGHPLRVDFQVAEGSLPLVGEPVPRPVDGLIRVDGTVAKEFPIDRPYLFQHQTDGGLIKHSAVVGVGAKIPAYDSGRGFQSGRTQGRAKASVDRAQRTGGAISVNGPLAIISGGAALVSGITYVVAMSKAAEFHDPLTSQAKLDRLRDSTNTLVWISGSFATVAVSTGAAALVVGGKF